MSRRSLRMMLAAFVAAAALSCGDVPTLTDGIAFYTPVLLPSPAVALGDTLRDSLGRAAPLRVRAFTRDSQEITGLTVTFTPTVLPSLVTIDNATGFVVAHDTATGSSQIVGRVGDRFQTNPATLLVVPEPTNIARSDNPAGDTVLTVPVKSLSVTVTGPFKGSIATVNGIIVRYRIDSLAPAARGSAVLTNPTGSLIQLDSTIALDTTKVAGNSTRQVIVHVGTGVQKVYVSASANHLHDATPLTGSPVRWVIELKP
jgi:hypothetical protein